MSDPDAVPASTTPAAPQGWHPDPTDAQRERWWDGVAWTEFTRLARSPEGRWAPTRERLALRPDDANRFLSIIVGSPVWVGVLYWLESMLSVPWLMRLPLEAWPLLKIGFFVIMTLALTALAAFDVRTLRARGFVEVPSALWALATPIVYLWVRGRVVDGADRIPLVIHLGLLIVSVLGVALGVAFGIWHLAV